MSTQHYTHLCTGHATDNNHTALSVLASLSQLPRMRIKDAMAKGAVWLKRGSSNTRLRRATTDLLPGDQLSLHYNPDILALIPPVPVLIADEKHFSVWHKPPGLLAQGTLEGDHCSLLRIASQQLNREALLVHRLDREAEGLMLIAHTGKAAAALSALFARQHGAGIHKLYQVKVRGQLAALGEFNSPLDGKPALTRFKLLAYEQASDSSLVEVELVTGRKHQIRRHFAAAGFPVLGDPQYGSNNQDARGLQLRAIQLDFTCPFTGKPRRYHLP